ncbi:NAC domain-containing protein [Vigna angularis]|uniref:NAC domain-containing protein n=1 Tax=Phaseolus angularis TaxID=3914 RepID=A0A8T0KWD0_PHAAN|nr:NAC domain-containing protein [Vigna angularis]
MENVYKPSKENQKLNLPTGFRFHPTDEELIKCYLTKKVADNCFCAVAIAESEWVVCRVFEKSPSGRRLHVRRLNSSGNESSSPSSLLPPLMDSPPNNSETRTTAGELSQVISRDPNHTVDKKNTHDDIVESMETPILNLSSSATPFAVYPFGKPTLSVADQPAQIANQIGNSQYPDYCYMPQDQSLKMLMTGNHEPSAKQIQKAEFSDGREFDADIETMLENQEIHELVQGMWAPIACGITEEG